MKVCVSYFNFHSISLALTCRIWETRGPVTRTTDLQFKKNGILLCVKLLSVPQRMCTKFKSSPNHKFEWFLGPKTSRFLRVLHLQKIVISKTITFMKKCVMTLFGNFRLNNTRQICSI